MQVIVDLCVVPIGVGTSASQYIAACEEEISKRGLKHQLHAYGTNIEGEWDEVFAAVKACHELLHALDVPRISSSMRVGTRSDRVQSMQQKINSVTQKLQTSLNSTAEEES